jgi:putative ABC transport system permease protein
VEDLLFYVEGKTMSDQVDVHLATVENDYFKTLSLSILAGRGFSKEFTADSNSIELNETALKDLRLDIRTALGKKINSDFHDVHSTIYIVLVVKNFNFESLYNSIKPFGFTTSIGNRCSYAIINVRATNYASLLKEMENTWNKINPGKPFVY